MYGTNFKQKMINIFKEYGSYILASIVLLFVLGLFVFAIIFSATNTGSNNPIINDDSNHIDNEVSTPVATVKTYALPLLNATLLKGYYDKELVFNDSLRHWETHRSLDLTSDNTTVMSIADGVVKEVYSNYLEGNVIKIEHADGLMSVYASLDDNINLKVGDVVSKGQVVGVMSDSAYSEVKTGNHLHFTMLKDGEKVDPLAYLNIDYK